MKQIRFFSELLAEKFGAPLQRIPFDLGLSCPNRCSELGPCAFCASDGALARHLSTGMDFEVQAQTGRTYVKNRYGSDGPYLAYFQAFTSTFAPVDQLRKLYSAALKTGDYKALVISTRPDCLPDDCLDYLCELKEQYELWIELGVQTANDHTLEKIHRGHDFACVRNAVQRLHERSIHCAAHLILGLPGEDQHDFLQTADAVAALPFEAVKMHNLLILQGTKMAKMYRAGEVQTMNEYQYAKALAAFLRRLPDAMSVMRLCADAPPDTLIAPKWWMKKGQFRDMFLRYYQQGHGSPFDFFCKTEDGSYTYYHPAYHQHFHSTAGAGTESYKKYVEPCRIREALESGKNLTVLDVGFGMGFNVSALYRTCREVGKGSLHVVSMELDPAVLNAAAMLPEHPAPDLILALQKDSRYESGSFRAEILFGDARKIIPEDMMFDAIFLDGFTPDANPELWSCDFLALLKKHLKPEGRLATYSSAYPVIGGLLNCGFHIYVSEPFGRKRGGLIASPGIISDLPEPDEKDLLIATKSTAGVPYPDPGLSHNRKEILEMHRQTVLKRREQGIPKWYKKNYLSREVYIFR